MNLTSLEKRVQLLTPAEPQIVFVAVQTPDGVLRALLGGSTSAGAPVPTGTRCLTLSPYQRDESEKEMAALLLDELAGHLRLAAASDPYQRRLLHDAWQHNWPARDGRPARIILEPIGYRYED
jgi:hypothetical protein